MILRTAFARATLAAALSLSAALAQAEGNSLYILQDSSLGGGTGNTIFVDQSAATDSLVAGSLTGPEASPAAQIGSANDAFLSLTGNSVSAVLLQGSNSLPAIGNSVRMTISGDRSIGTARQFGQSNVADLLVSGLDSLGEIDQQGDGNAANLVVTGNGSVGTIGQIGDRNDTTLRVEGDNMTVNYEIIGNGTTTVLPPTVRGNSTSVQITQYAGN